MDLKQLKEDREKGVLICNSTWNQLIAYAEELQTANKARTQAALQRISDFGQMQDAPVALNDSMTYVFEISDSVNRGKVLVQGIIDWKDYPVGTRFIASFPAEAPSTPAEQADLTNKQMVAALNAQGALTEVYRDIAMSSVRKGSTRLPPLPESSWTGDNQFDFGGNPFKWTDYDMQHYGEECTALAATAEQAQVFIEQSGDPSVQRIRELDRENAALKAQQSDGDLPQDERAAFEAWIIAAFDECGEDEPNLELDENGRYTNDMRVLTAWQVWQARAAVAQRAGSGEITPQTIFQVQSSYFEGGVQRWQLGFRESTQTEYENTAPEHRRLLYTAPPATAQAICKCDPEGKHGLAAAVQPDSERDAALEVAAKICESLLQYPGTKAGVDGNLYEAAQAIRALATATPQTREG